MITFESFVTPTGVIVAAGLVTALVELIKTVFPKIDARVSGAVLAFSLSAILYVVTALATMPATPDAGLVLFAAWLSCATSAVGIKAATTHAVTNIGGTS